MIKNLKLNIKNTQLAEALQKQAPAEDVSKKTKARISKTASESAPIEEEQRPKAHIIRKAKVKEEQPAEEAQAPVRKARILREPTPEVAPTPIAAVEQPAAQPVQEPKKAEPEVAKPVAREPQVNETVAEKPSRQAEQPAEASTGAALAPVAPAPVKPVKLGPVIRASEPTGTAPLNAPQAGQKGQGYTSTAAASSSMAKPSHRQNLEAPSRGPTGSGTSTRTGSDTRSGSRSGSEVRHGMRPGSDTRSRPGFESDRQRPRGDNRSQPRRSEGPSNARADQSANAERPPRSAASAGQRFGQRPTIRESFSERQARISREQQEQFQQTHSGTARPRLGPTGKHFRDLVPEKPALQDQPIRYTDQEKAARAAAHMQRRKEDKSGEAVAPVEGEDVREEVNRNRTFDRSKPSKAIKKTVERVRIDTTRIDEDAPWRKKRPAKRNKSSHEDLTIRPTSLHVRLPILVKDLAQEMKLKASQLISKLFLQGMAVTLNDVLDDETTVQLLGQEFGCEIAIDRREDDRIRITSKSIAEEIQDTGDENLVSRPPVVAFMGHVDHGKTSLIDSIRKSNRVAGEAGAITQHIGAFSCHTEHGDLTILDTPGHEAFAAMRERGAMVTDVIVLVIAGDEGIKPQTDEAIRHALAVNATILVAINKCDKPNFNAENVYRQLAERNLLPEAWGGKIVTVNCSAVTGEGITELLEMIALQSEVLELRANPSSRARGSVIEAELHKGLGNVATVLVQNGTLRYGDALVFNQSWGRVKTMRDEFGRDLKEAKPSQAARITGLSSLPEAGEEFIVVANEKEAREIAEVRAQQLREKQVVQARKKFTLEALMQHAQQGKKVLHCILRADVQGSVEALRFELMKIKSDKVEINIVSEGIGEISESDVQLAAASGAVIIGFHAKVEAHAEDLIKQHSVKVRCYDVIYHAVDGVKELMVEQLDKIAEEHPRGRAQVKAIFRSSQLGKIAGCQAMDGTIQRSYRIRVVRAGKVLWDGSIASLRRGKDDVREVSKGFEFGILLQGFNELEVDDILESYEITYRTQSL